MASIKQIKIGNTTYDIEDVLVKSSIPIKGTTPAINFYVGTNTSPSGQIFYENNLMKFTSANGGYDFDNQIYTTAAVLETSDRNKKKDFKEFDERYENMFFDLKPQVYKFKDGKSDRFHSGFISQEVEEAVLANGMDSKDFAAYCINPRTENNETEYDYMLRYEEFIALNTHMLQKAYEQMDEMKTTIESLQKEIETLKSK